MCTTMTKAITTSTTRSNQPSYIDTFNVFDEDDQKSTKDENIIWSDSLWTPTTASSSTLDFKDPNDVDTSFDSHANFFGLSAVEAPAEFGFNPFAQRDDSNSITQQQQQQLETDEIFPWDPMANLVGNDLASPMPEETTVMVMIREQFSTIYDDAGSTPSCHLEGAVYVSTEGICANDNRHEIRSITS